MSPWLGARRRQLTVHLDRERNPAEPVAGLKTKNATSANATVPAASVNGTAAEPVAGPKTKNATSANATVPAASVNGTAAEPVAEPATENATSANATVPAALRERYCGWARGWACDEERDYRDLRDPWLPKQLP